MTHFDEFIVFIRADNPICISEGFNTLTRIKVIAKEKTIIATINIIRSNILSISQVSLSESACATLHLNEGDPVRLVHLPPIKSLQFLRDKINGKRLTEDKYQAIINYVVLRNFSNTQIAAFLASCANNHLSTDEIIGLSKAMVKAGEKITWTEKIIADKHCIGGLPGNRITPIVVSIVSALGIKIPKTSSRAITSPAGTIDTMKVFTNVNISIKEIKSAIQQNNGCLVWGGAIGLSPADDLLIKIERTLDLDGEGQMIASILSKKIATGSTHVIIDIPVGHDLKTTNYEDAELLKERFLLVGSALGLKLKILITDGSQPVGYGIGPALEAMDVYNVLDNSPEAPCNLKERTILLAGELLELVGYSENKEGRKVALQVLESRQAFKQFEKICLTQGRFSKPLKAPYEHKITALKKGKILGISTKICSKTAKLSGVPYDKSAGVFLSKKINDLVKKGDTLLTIYAQSKGELNYASDFARQYEIFKIE